MPASVSLIEVAPRDGLQNESAPVDTATKLELVRRLIAAGLRRIELASFVNPRRVPQMADADALCAALPQTADVSYSGLVMNQRGLDRALHSGRLNEIGLVVPATDSFAQRNQGASTGECLRLAVELCRQARRAGLRCTPTIAVAFGCPFEGEVAPETVATIARALAEADPDELVLADTIGVAVPGQVSALIGAVQRAIGRAIPLRGHFHNTRNTAVANVCAALAAGVDRFDASVGGVGGCPFAPAATGNVATEDLWYLLHRMGYATGIEPQALIDTAQWLGQQLGRPLPGMVSRAGSFPPSARASGDTQ